MEVLFATKSNGSISEADFKSPIKAVKEPKAEKVVKPQYDLVIKNGKFTLNKKFLEGQQEFQGWNVGRVPETTQVMLFRNLTEEGFKKTIFWKGVETSKTIKSDALDLAIQWAGLSTEVPFYLIPTESPVPGFEAFILSVTAPVEETVEEQPITSEQVQELFQTGVEEQPQPVDEVEAQEVIEA